MVLSIKGRKLGKVKAANSGIKKGYVYDAKLAKASVQEQLDSLGFNPILQMAFIADGDVVRLGWMTIAELNEPAKFNDKGNCVKESGIDRALGLVPPALRAKATGELLQYIRPRLQATTVGNPDGSKMEVVNVQLYLPDNGRK